MLLVIYLLICLKLPNTLHKRTAFFTSVKQNIYLVSCKEILNKSEACWIKLDSGNNNYLIFCARIFGVFEIIHLYYLPEWHLKSGIYFLRATNVTSTEFNVLLVDFFYVWPFLIGPLKFIIVGPGSGPTTLKTPIHKKSIL